MRLSRESTWGLRKLASQALALTSQATAPRTVRRTFMVIGSFEAIVGQFQKATLCVPFAQQQIYRLHRPCYDLKTLQQQMLKSITKKLLVVTYYLVPGIQTAS